MTRFSWHTGLLSAPLLEFQKPVLHQVAQPVQCSVIVPLYPAVLLGGITGSIPNAWTVAMISLVS